MTAASAALASAAFEGRVRHRRLVPFERQFENRIFMMYLDLDELPEVFSMHPLWGTRRRSPARFHRADYLGRPDRSLADCVRDRFESDLGLRLDGPVRVLTHLRYWGVCFNPITVYYGFGDRSDCRPAAALAEVTNTPWGERHTYAIPRRGDSDGGAGDSHGALSVEVDKELHVSPMMPMDQTYKITCTDPSDTIGVHVAASRQGEAVFDATLSLARSDLSGATMTRLLLARPPMPAVVLGGIYYQALRTRLRGARWYRHARQSDRPDLDPTKSAAPSGGEVSNPAAGGQ